MGLFKPDLNKFLSFQIKIYNDFKITKHLKKTLIISFPQNKEKIIKSNSLQTQK